MESSWVIYEKIDQPSGNSEGVWLSFWCVCDMCTSGGVHICVWRSTLMGNWDISTTYYLSGEHTAMFSLLLLWMPSLWPENINPLGENQSFVLQISMKTGSPAKKSPCFILLFKAFGHNCLTPVYCLLWHSAIPEQNNSYGISHGSFLFTGKTDVLLKQHVVCLHSHIHYH